MQLADSGLRISMVNYNNRLFCRLDNNLTPIARRQKKLKAIEELGLLESSIIPVFDEATQTAANYLEAPVGILGLMVDEELWLKSAVGLSHIGLMNQLAVSRKLQREESFATYVVDSQNCLVINDTISNSVFAGSILTQHYGIRAYLGAPLVTATGECIGSLAVMDLEPRHFSRRDVEFLAMTARWCLSEFERNRYQGMLSSDSLALTKAPTTNSLSYPHQSPRVLEGEIEQPAASWQHSQRRQASNLPELNSPDAIKVKLLAHLTQELRTPLTSVMGMASVLGREVYGPLTEKQKEYLDVIHNSGQHLLTLVEEIVNLDILDQSPQKLQLNSVDIEMLSQQALQNLFHIAQENKQEISLSVEPGSRIWLLDKDKVRQAIYYLVVSVMAASETSSEIRVHVSRKPKDFLSNTSVLSVAVWVSHPWLGDGISQIDHYSSVINANSNHGSSMGGLPNYSNSGFLRQNERHVLNQHSLAEALVKAEKGGSKSSDNRYRELLGLLLSCHLTEMHGGEISVQGSVESGYRYILNLPEISEAEAI